MPDECHPGAEEQPEGYRCLDGGDDPVAMQRPDVLPDEMQICGLRMPHHHRKIGTAGCLKNVAIQPFMAVWPACTCRAIAGGAIPYAGLRTCWAGQQKLKTV